MVPPIGIFTRRKTATSFNTRVPSLGLLRLLPQRVPPRPASRTHILDGHPELAVFVITVVRRGRGDAGVARRRGRRGAAWSGVVAPRVKRVEAHGLLPAERAGVVGVSWDAGGGRRGGGGGGRGRRAGGHQLQGAAQGQR